MTDPPFLSVFIRVHLRRSLLTAWLIAAAFPGTARAAEQTAWARDAIVYHLYVRSFADSDGDGHGDLRGLISRLDHIQSLGADAILLLPIQRSDYDHFGGYAVTDYFAIEDDYGTLEDFEALVAACHARGIRVLLDLSMCIVADTHPWFVAARARADAAERQHFIVRPGPDRPPLRGIFGLPAWQPLDESSFYYASYTPEAPNTNIRNEATARYFGDVAEFWLRRGADGFRLDSAPHMGEVGPTNPNRPTPAGRHTHAFWRGFMSRVKQVKPSAIGVAEVMDADLNKVIPFYHDGIDMTFDYPLYFRGILPALRDRSKRELSAVLPQVLAARPAGTFSAVFLDNHDVPGQFVPPYGRVADLLGGEPARLKLAAMLLFSLPGTPFIYYGDEIGLRSDSTGRTSRNPMQWDASAGRGFTMGEPWLPLSVAADNVASQHGAPDSVLETYRRLAAARRRTPALRRGTCIEIPTDNEAVLALLREDIETGQRVLAVTNLGPHPVRATLDLTALGIGQASMHDLLIDQRLPPLSPASTDQYELDLGAYSGHWLMLK